MRTSDRNFTRREILTMSLGVFTAGRVILGGEGAESYAAAQDTPVTNYRTPRREYVAEKVGAYLFQVEKSLQNSDREIAQKALDRFVKNIDKALETLPKPASAELRNIRYFVMHGPKARGGGRNNGLEYIQTNAPSFHAELDPRWGNSMVLYCAQNYLVLSDLWAIKAVVHEYGHAYQLLNWPEDQPDIMRAYTNAMKQGLYRKVKDVNEKTLDAAYATTNQLEYFAELTAMYFVGCNYQPFDRTELKEYDPAGYAMIERLWRVGEGTSKKAPARPAKRSRR